MGGLAEFKTLEDLFERFFSESGCKLWDEHFLKDALEMPSSTLAQLILSQGDIGYSRNMEDSQRSTHLVTSQRKI